MAKRIEVGERVIGSTLNGRWGTRQIVGVLQQKPDDQYEPYLVRDRRGFYHPCWKIRRLRG